MTGVRVQVTRIVDDAFPGFVECALVDVHGRRWLFREKGPVVTNDYLTASDAYPQPGVIACQVVARAGGVVRIDTIRPWHVESAEGETQFEVAEELLVDW
jgi:hypothetical protein